MKIDRIQCAWWYLDNNVLKRVMGRIHKQGVAEENLVYYGGSALTHTPPDGTKHDSIVKMYCIENRDFLNSNHFKIISNYQFGI